MIDIYLDSSNTSMTVAIGNDNGIIASTSYEAWQRQSEVMIPELNSLLEKYGFSKDDIKSVVVCVGPGSYTGVRISITIAKTIAAALNVDVYPISSLHALKDGDKPSICLINARSKRSYIGVYQGNKCLLEDTIFTNEQVLEYINNHPGYSLCGELDYLNLVGVKSDLANEMFNIKKEEKPYKNPLGLSPVYLKD